MPEIMFEELADNAPVMIWRSGPDKLCNWCNQLWLDFTGRSMEQEFGFGWAEGIHPEDLEACISRYNDAFDAREKFSMIYRLRRHDGVYRWLMHNGAPFNKGGAFAGYFGTCTDISEQREAHDVAVRAIGERDALLREVYHRVKNNLQQLDGLIAIEGTSARDPEAREALQALSGRVRAMGAVHQRLISSGSMTDLPVSDFVLGLCADLALSLGADKRGIVLTAHADSGVMHIERAVIVGLLINELVTNAFKHAFPVGKHGQVTVRCVRLPSGFMLEVADVDVGGTPAAGQSEPPARSGMRLIMGFVQQLRGQLEIDRTVGTRVTVKF